VPTVVLGVTGCIGAYKACEVLRELQRRDVTVRVVMTQSATRFVAPMTFEALSQHPVFVDQFALGENGEIRHISLADEAELLLIAPATANVIGKLAHGIADDALTTLYTATKAPTLVAPAMNVNMFEHPAVVENLQTLRRRGVGIVEPGEGYLACGWLGRGRLAEVEAIVAAAMSRLEGSAVPAVRHDLEGRRVLVTAGPTVEDVDPVRFLSNRSSGKMGYRLAEAAQGRGARVVLVSGPTSLAPPAGVELVPVRSAEEMARAVAEHGRVAEIVVMAAAVADYRPARASDSKLKKGEGGMSLELVRTPDILKGLGQDKRGRMLVGFAAETDDVLANARRKLESKNLDLIVANRVGGSAGGFGSDENAAVLLDAGGGSVEVPLTGKRELAERIRDRVVELRQATHTPAPAPA
jgi:phosphopantothenoylcysteine decarboxylase/phosphopantothenate--cysteine ligase